MRNEKDFGFIADNELEYLKHCKEIIHISYCNPFLIQCQQVLEKDIKQLISENGLTGMDTGILKINNLNILYNFLKKLIVIELPKHNLRMIKDYYFEASYPGDEYFVATIEQCEECFEITLSLHEKLKSLRKPKNLS